MNECINVCNNGSCCTSCNSCNAGATCITCQNVKKSKSEIIELLKVWNKLGITNSVEVLEKVNEILVKLTTLEEKIDEINSKLP